MSSPVAINKKFAAYPEYKDSDIEWVGDIPINWNVLPAFAVLREECIRNLDGAETNVLSLSYGAIKQRDVESNAGLLPESFNTYQLVNYGDIVLRLTDLQNDKRSLRVGRSTQKGIITSAYMKLVCLHQLDNRFAYQLLHSYDTTKVFYGMGGGLRQSMKFEDFRRLPVIVPPLEEQRTIAAFLDYETARIDQLIAKQQKLIELLKEKRQAVISLAVTKGLNPDAPMKDSGVEWLGQVPLHWMVAGFKKYLEPIVDYRGKTPNKTESGVFLVTARNIKNGTVDYDLSQEYISEDDYEEVMRRGKPQIGDVLFTTEAPLGEVAQVDRDDIALAQRVIKFRGASGVIDNTYLKIFIQSTHFRQGLMTFATGSTALGIKSDRLGYLRQLIPPIVEQQEIVSSVVDSLKKFDELISVASSGIKLMQDRRTALISAAVTGKIDLRGWRPPVKDVAA
ncbi:restriction endonuclease subunit S [Shewanella mangrovisoli]|uniref:restriction endonuclease subunit S n=1 Tax=Shewanella mangrovisoli TaxID=2864211 RepID=UPI0035B741C5